MNIYEVQKKTNFSYNSLFRDHIFQAMCLHAALSFGSAFILVFLRLIVEYNMTVPSWCPDTGIQQAE